MNCQNTPVVPRLRAAMLASVSVLGFSAATATADVIDFVSHGEAATEGIASFSGSLNYEADLFGESGTLIISLTNTSDPCNGGLITGVAFNVASDDPNATASLTAASHPFIGLSNANAAPFGTFATGAALGGHWLGGGSPHSGIGVGDTGTFEFLIAASDAGSLTAESFLAGPNEHNFVVRLRGFSDGGSDKVPAISTTALIPTPGSLSVLMLAGLARPRRRR